MSDNLMQIIPQDHLFVPSAPGQDAAVKIFRRIAPAADWVKCRTTETVRFIHCGSNWEGAECPRCDEDLGDWFWSEAKRCSESSQFVDLSVQTPCCHFLTTLNDLRYPFHVG